MSNYSGNHEECGFCGLTYGRFRSGYTYQAAHDLLKDYSDDPTAWRYKRRNTVLGYMHQLKLEAWAYHKLECEQQRLFELEVPF